MMGCSKLATRLGLPNGSTQDVVHLSATFLLKPTVWFTVLNDEDEPETHKNFETPSKLPQVEVRPSPGRGSGLFALDRIPAFTRILEDDAIISLAEGDDLPQAWQKYCLLPPEEQKIIDDLTFPAEQHAEKQESISSQLKQRGYSSDEAWNMARLNSRWQTNAFGIQDPNIGSPFLRALYPTVAKINHSCTPNAHAHTRAPATQYVYAVRDIEAGEEIEIAYFDVTMPRADRQARAKYMCFECTCPACVPNGQLAQSGYEQRLAMVHRHTSVDFNTSNPGMYIDSAQTAIDIAESNDYPWLVVSLPRLYIALYSCRMRLNHSKAAIEEAVQKGLEWEEKLTGWGSSDSKAARTLLATTGPLVERLRKSRQP